MYMFLILVTLLKISSRKTHQTSFWWGTSHPDICCVRCCFMGFILDVWMWHLALYMAAFFSVSFRRELVTAVELVFLVLEIDLNYGTFTSQQYMNKTSWDMRMLGTENYFLVLFLNCFLEFLWVFLVFCFFLDNFSQLSYTSQLFKSEQQEHSQQRGEGLPFPPASCLVDVLRLIWRL